MGKPSGQRAGKPLGRIVRQVALAPSSKAAVALALGMLPLLTHSVEPQEGLIGEERRAGSDAKVLFFRMEGTIDRTLLERKTAQVRRGLADNPETTHVIFLLDSTGGEPAAASEMADFVLEALKSYRTVAFIPPDKMALAEAALVALAAHDIAMGKDSRLGGDRARKPGGGEDEVKLRDAFRRCASARGFPTLLAEAMIARATEDVIAVRFARPAGGVEEHRIEFLTRRDFETLDEKKRLLRKGDEIALKAGDLFTVSEKEAREKFQIPTIHIARDLTEIQTQLGILVGPENVIDLDHGPLKAQNPQAQGIVDFLNQPFIRFLLLLCGSLGLLVELKMFGTFIPGAIGLACFTIFFVASLLPISGSPVGTASGWEVLLFVLGLGLVSLEVFLLPGMAIFALTGAALSTISLVLAMVPPAGSELESHLTVEDAIGILAFGFGAGSICFLFILRYLPHSSIFARRGLVSNSAILGVPTADSALAAQAIQASIIGKVGTAVTALRPSGKVEIEDGRFLDVLAEGNFVEKGTRVKVLRCDGGTTVVQEVDARAS
ncbi:MAG TPA: NfeD family protein [Planctomycetota bacterium]|nr:NfeD family protein [Planctomycetota bacterium]